MPAPSAAAIQSVAPVRPPPRYHPAANNQPAPQRTSARADESRAPSALPRGHELEAPGAPAIQHNQWEDDRKCRALAEYAFASDASLVRFHDFLGDCQAQPCAL